MIKQFKIFESIFEYKYLDKDDEELIEVYIRDFLRDKNILKKINRLTLNDFEDADVAFDCFSMFLSLLSYKTYNSADNIYYYIDSKIKDIKGRFPTIKLKNSMHNILEKIYDSSIKEKINKKLISILEKKPDKYDEIYELYYEELNDEVKKACSWMLGYKKFNL